MRITHAVAGDLYLHSPEHLPQPGHQSEIANTSGWSRTRIQRHNLERIARAFVQWRDALQADQIEPLDFPPVRVFSGLLQHRARIRGTEAQTPARGPRVGLFKSRSSQGAPGSPSRPYEEERCRFVDARERIEELTPWKTHVAPAGGKRLRTEATSLRTVPVGQTPRTRLRRSSPSSMRMLVTRIPEMRSASHWNAAF